jgi:hypothetical protein
LVLIVAEAASGSVVLGLNFGLIKFQGGVAFIS